MQSSATLLVGRSRQKNAQWYKEVRLLKSLERLGSIAEPKDEKLCMRCYRTEDSSISSQRYSLEYHLNTAPEHIAALPAQIAKVNICYGQIYFRTDISIGQCPYAKSGPRVVYSLFRRHFEELGISCSSLRMASLVCGYEIYLLLSK